MATHRSCATREWMAAAGGAMSAALLTADLGRPERFLNMLRVFKPQSAMSVGSWTLTAFSSLSGASAFAAAMDRRLGGSMPVRLVHDVAAPAAALLGTVMSTYTGVLIGATAIPVWNRNVRLLPLHFGASGIGVGGVPSWSCSDTTIERCSGSASPRPPSRPQPASSSRCEEAKRCRRCVTGSAAR